MRALRRAALAAGAGGVGLYVAGSTRLDGDSCVATAAFRAARPVVFAVLPPEAAHWAFIAGGKLLQAAPQGLVPTPANPPSLRTRVLGIDFQNPIGMAAGFDKNGEVTRAMELLGWGFVEVGSVTAKESPGNAAPRCFRLPDDHAVINRMGLNNDGADAISARLKEEVPKCKFPVGVNIAKTHDPAIVGELAIADFVHSYRKVSPHAAYVTINISCPNTREGKTFEDPEALQALLGALGEERKSGGPPLLVKFSPLPAEVTKDTEKHLRQVARICVDNGVSGFIASNTVPDRKVALKTPGDDVAAIGNGGLSGLPVEQRSTGLVRLLYDECGGTVPIIGLGGVASAEAAYRKIRAGASLVQLYTGVMYNGPMLHRDIVYGLDRLLRKDGFRSVAEAVGADAVTAAVRAEPVKAAAVSADAELVRVAAVSADAADAAAAVRADAAATVSAAAFGDAAGAAAVSAEPVRAAAVSADAADAAAAVGVDAADAASAAAVSAATVSADTDAVSAAAVSVSADTDAVSAAAVSADACGDE
eukprot:TRINITY_DN8225_c0_g1_i3.p1 TRINITY_DN8225_c0_g1~~TRINITY_DN8225_c0_g1_i3.p1  ORF type:complete len:534 (+),score=144.32 TRINITY_DN8225_c0_g1_i3:76-1677(+)